MSNQTDGRRSAKKQSTTREHFQRPPVTATGLLCRPPNTPHDPCKSLRSRGSGQSKCQPSPGSAFATLGATTSSVRNRPRLLVPAAVHFDSCILCPLDRPSHPVPRGDSMRQHPMASLCCPPYPLLPPSVDWPSTDQVPRPLSTLPPMPRLLPHRKPCPRKTHANAHEQEQPAMLSTPFTTRLGTDTV